MRLCFQALARKILKKPIEVQIGGKSVVSDTIQQHVLILDEDQKFLKLLELLGIYQATGLSLIDVLKYLLHLICRQYHHLRAQATRG